MLYMISDTHFSHANIIGYAGRPFRNTNDMNRAMIENWNVTVKPEDTVFHLGDFTFGSFNSHLNGRIILVKGNHDRRLRWDERHFDQIVEKAVVQIGPYRCLLVHRPHDNRFVSNYVNPGYDYIIHGHTHQQIKRDGLYINMCVDAWDFKPVSVEEIYDLMVRPSHKLIYDRFREDKYGTRN